MKRNKRKKWGEPEASPWRPQRIWKEVGRNRKKCDVEIRQNQVDIQMRPASLIFPNTDSLERSHLCPVTEQSINWSCFDLCSSCLDLVTRTREKWIAQNQQNSQQSTSVPFPHLLLSVKAQTRPSGPSDPWRTELGGCNTELGSSLNAAANSFITAVILFRDTRDCKGEPAKAPRPIWYLRNRADEMKEPRPLLGCGTRVWERRGSLHDSFGWFAVKP